VWCLRLTPAAVSRASDAGVYPAQRHCWAWIPSSNHLVVKGPCWDAAAAMETELPILSVEVTLDQLPEEMTQFLGGNEGALWSYWLELILFSSLRPAYLQAGALSWSVAWRSRNAILRRDAAVICADRPLRLAAVPPSVAHLLTVINAPAWAQRCASAFAPWPGRT